MSGRETSRIPTKDEGLLTTDRCVPAPSATQRFRIDTQFCPRDGAALASPTDMTAALGADIIRPLGSGSMGTVFLAEQIGVGNRPVALKLLQHKLLDDSRCGTAILAVRTIPPTVGPHSDNPEQQPYTLAKDRTRQGG